MATNNEFNFQSPGVKIRETDLTANRVEQLGVTTAAIVGEFPKGPAFERIFLKNQTEKTSVFGQTTPEKIGNNLKYLGQYYADQYLEEGNQLYITRVLGLSGYNAGKVWTLSIPTGVDSTPTASTITNIDTQDVVSLSKQFTLNTSNQLVIGSTTYSNINFNSINSGSNVSPAVSDGSFTINSAKTKFTALGKQFIFNNVTDVVSSTLDYTATTRTFNSSTSFTNISAVTLTSNTVTIQPTFLLAYIPSINSFDIFRTGFFDNTNYFPVSEFITRITGVTSSNINIDTTTSKIVVYNNSIGYSSTTLNSFYMTNDIFMGYQDPLNNNYNSVNYYSSQSNKPTVVYIVNTLNNISAVTTSQFTDTVTSFTGKSFIYDNNTGILSIPSDNLNLSTNLISSAFTISDSGYSDSSTYVNNVTVKRSYNFKNLGSLVNNLKIGDLQEYNVLYSRAAIITPAKYKVVATLRSNASYSANNLIFDVNTVTISNSTNKAFGDFTLTANGSFGTETYVCSLDPSKSNYIEKVLNKSLSSNKKLILENVYTNYIRKSIENNTFYLDAPSKLTEIDNNQFKDFNTQYKSPETPFVVSELQGNTVKRLFKFVNISDGDSANKEIKISITNIEPSTGEFDVVIRDFNDTDENPVILEQFSKCTMNESVNNFIGKKIGCVLENDLNSTMYDIVSKYVYIVLPVNFSQTSYPCGFEGYKIRNYSNIDSTLLPLDMLYKTSYSTSDNINRTYLGISEKAFNTSTFTSKNVDSDILKYIGVTNSSQSIATTNGFHLDVNATGVTTTTFTVGTGAIRNSTDVLSGTYSNKAARKFTVLSYGGFDGWDIYRSNRTNTDLFKVGAVNGFSTSDYYAYLLGYREYANSEASLINILMTPGVNFSDNESLVSEVISMIENERQDCLYLIDAPDLPSSPNLANEIVGLLDSTSINTSYGATYYSWIKIVDSLTKTNIYIPPTGEVARVIALTDKTNAPWFAPAGLTRGLLTQGINVRKTFTEADRDILQQGRINPIAKFTNVGLDIFGQRTLRGPVSDNSLLNKINVRRLMLYAKQVVKEISRTLLFEQNDEVAGQQFLDKVNPIFEQVKRDRGLRRFSVAYSPNNTPETIDRGQLFFQIKLTPTSALEEIGIDFILTPSDNSVSFTEA